MIKLPKKRPPPAAETQEAGGAVDPATETCPPSIYASLLSASSSPTCALSASVLLPVLVLLLIVAVVRSLLRRRSGTAKSNARTMENLTRHAVITGGSSGIGLAVARDLCLTRSCRRVTLIARNKDGLRMAKDSIEKELLLLGLEGTSTTPQDDDGLASDGVAGDGGGVGGGGPIVDVVSVDVTDFTAVQRAADEICCSSPSWKGGGGGPPTLLFNVAGTSSSGRFVETDFDEFERLMRINYLGSVNVTRAFLPYMMGERGRGPPPSDGKNGEGTGQPDHQPSASGCAPPAASTVVLTSSGAGQVGIYGYSAYSPTKFALRGLAECLTMELPPSIAVQVAYPPDTDTPGYELEQVGKPRETKLMSDVMGLAKAEDVARVMVDAALSPHPRYSVYFGLEGWMLSTLTAGMGPPRGLLDVLCQVLLMGVLRFVSLFYLWDFARIVDKCRREEGEGEGGGAGAGAGGGKAAPPDAAEEDTAEEEEGGDDEARHDENGGTIKGEWLCGGAGW